jgi:hypothetical protein
VSAERPGSNERHRLGRDPATPVVDAQPVADLGASPVHIGHELEPHAADRTPVDYDRLGSGRVDDPDASDVRLRIA